MSDPIYQNNLIIQYGTIRQSVGVTFLVLNFTKHCIQGYALHPITDKTTRVYNNLATILLQTSSKNNLNVETFFSHY